jgi:hypothetical protein
LYSELNPTEFPMPTVGIRTQHVRGNMCSDQKS